MSTEITTSTNIKNLLGSFWTEYHNKDDKFLDSWAQWLSLSSRQIDQNTQELRDSFSIKDTPIYHRELWRSIPLVQDMDTGSYYQLRYDDDAAVYGELGAPPIHDQLFNYGDFTQGVGLETSGVLPESVMFLVDSTTEPSFILTKGVDFIIKNGMFVFSTNIADRAEVFSVATEDVNTHTVVYNFTGYACDFDLQTAAQQWGYLIGFEGASSTTYNKALWSLWKARRFGLSSDIFAEIVSIYLDCPRCKTNGEVVTRIISRDDREYCVITTSNVYHIPSNDTPNVVEGQTLVLGEFIGQKVKILESAPASGLSESVSVLEEYNRPVGDSGSGFVETNYILFNATDAPATISKYGDVDYTPSYAVISGSFGNITLRVKNLSRFTANKFTITIDTDVIPGTQTQNVSLQVYSTTNVPLFSEPFTGSIASVPGTVQLITDLDDLLRIEPQALSDKISSVKRIALIAMFDDVESAIIKSTIESYYFTDGSTASVTVFKTINLYDDLTGAGTWITISRDHLLDYDLVMINTSSGVMSTLDGNSTAVGPTTAGDESIQALILDTGNKIASAKAQLNTLDKDLIWLLNYLDHSASATNTNWAYKLCGVLGTPSYATPQGGSYYKYGVFSTLEHDKVLSNEVNNRKSYTTPKVPSILWESSTNTGVSSTETVTPIYSKSITIDSSTPNLAAIFPSGYNYSYKVSKIEVL